MSLQACAERVQRGDPDRFLAAMAAPPEARRILFPIYAFNLEVARAPWVTQEAMISEMRLQWWRDALSEIAEGKVVRAYEVTTQLAQVLDAKTAKLLDKLVQARRWDIYRDPFEDAAHFDEFLDATSGNLIWATACALGASEAEKDVRALAWASGLANWFLAIPLLEARGRIPLVDGRHEAIQDLARRGLHRISTSKTPKSMRPVLLSTWRAKTLLQQAARHPERVGSGQLRQSEFLKKISLLRRSF